MFKSIGMLLPLVIATCLVGCGSGEPTNTMENEDQSAIEAYEAEMAAEEAAMSDDFSDE